MKPSDIIEKYRNKIAAAMAERFRIVYESYGRVQYRIYIWEDGELEIMQQAQGDNSWLKPHSCEDRELIYVDTVKSPFFNPFDGIEEPEDEAERDAEEAELIGQAMEEADCLIKCMIDDRIRELQREGM